MKFNLQKACLRTKMFCCWPPADQSTFLVCHRQYSQLCTGKLCDLVCTDGSANLVMLHRPDDVAVHTIFLGKLPEGKVQSWILILAIVVGILILLLIILALVKVGTS